MTPNGVTEESMRSMARYLRDNFPEQPIAFYAIDYGGIHDFGVLRPHLHCRGGIRNSDIEELHLNQSNEVNEFGYREITTRARDVRPDANVAIVFDKSAERTGSSIVGGVVYVLENADYFGVDMVQPMLIEDHFGIAPFACRGYGDLTGEYVGMPDFIRGMMTGLSEDATDSGNSEKAARISRKLEELERRFPKIVPIEPLVTGGEGPVAQKARSICGI